MHACACRQEGQQTTEEIAQRDLRTQLEEKERKHFAKAKGINFEGEQAACGQRRHAVHCAARVCSLLTATLFTTEERKKDLLLLEQGVGEAAGGKAPKALVPKAVDADDEDEPESESSSDDDDEVCMQGRGSWHGGHHEWCS